MPFLCKIPVNKKFVFCWPGSFFLTIPIKTHFIWSKGLKPFARKDFERIASTAKG